MAMFIMVGAVTGYYIAVKSEAWLGDRLPVWLELTAIFAGAIVVCCILGFLIEFSCLSPAAKPPAAGAADHGNRRVAPAGESFSSCRAFSAPPIKTIPDRIQTVFGDHFARVSLVISLVLMIGMTWVVMKTKTGLALRAVSYRFDTASSWESTPTGSFP